MSKSLIDKIRERKEEERVANLRAKSIIIRCEYIM